MLLIYIIYIYYIVYIIYVKPVFMQYLIDLSVYLFAFCN